MKFNLMFQQFVTELNKRVFKIPLFSRSKYRSLQMRLSKEEVALIPDYNDYFQTLLKIASSRKVSLVSVFARDLDAHCEANHVRPSLTGLRVVTLSK